MKCHRCAHVAGAIRSAPQRYRSVDLSTHPDSDLLREQCLNTNTSQLTLTTPGQRYNMLEVTRHIQQQHATQCTCPFAHHLLVCVCPSGCLLYITQLLIRGSLLDKGFNVPMTQMAGLLSREESLVSVDIFTSEDGIISKAYMRQNGRNIALAEAAGLPMSFCAR